MSEQIIEEWRPVVDYEGLYCISDLGNVKSLPRYTTSGRLMRTVETAGYLRVNLSKDNKQKMKFVHVLVLEAFIGARPQDHYAAHLNGISTDNRLANLIWATKELNELHKRSHGTHLSGERTPNAKLSWDNVRFIRENYKVITQKELAKLFGVHRTTIQRIQGGSRWHGK